MTHRSPIRQVQLITYVLLAFAVLPIHAISKEGCRGPHALVRQLGVKPTTEGYSTLGTWFAEHNQPSCSVALFEQAVNLNPTSARLHYLLGLGLNSVGRSARAIDELRLAAKLDPSDPQSHLALGAALHQVGDALAAAREWTEALQLDPGSVTALDWLTKEFITEGQYAAAIDLLNSAPADVALTIDLAVAYDKAGMFDAAMNALRAKLDAQPESFRLNIALATLLMQNHRYEEAAAALARVLKAQPEDEETQLLYLKVLVMMGDVSRALPLARKMLQNHPRNFDALYLNGMLERDDGDYATARDHLTVAAAINSEHYDVQFNLGAALAKLHQPQAARERLTKAIALDPSEPEAHFQLAGVLRTLGESEGADAQLGIYKELQAAKAQRELASQRSALAAAALVSGDAPNAVKLYGEAHEAQPNDPVLLYNLALALDRVGDFASEASALRQGITLKSDFAAAENQLGYLDARAGQAASAEQHFLRALQVNPRFADAENNLGTLLGEEGRDRDAEQHFRNAVSMNPRFGQAWINLAAVQASNSRFDEARQSVETALKLQPTNFEALKLKEMLADAKK